MDDALLLARVNDGNESITKSDIQVDWINARGFGSAFGRGPQFDDLVGWGNYGQSYSGYDDANWSM